MDFQTAKKRKIIIDSIKLFFDKRGYLEVDTPLLAPGLIPESTIEVFKAQYKHPYKDSRDMFLIPSPELHMKQLISQGSGSIYQVGKSFRNAEQVSPVHNIEFTMLEYYTVHANYKDSLLLTQELLRELDTKKLFSKSFVSLTMDEVFLNYAGFRLSENSTREALYEQGEKLKLFISESDDIESLYNKIFISLVEPSLPQDCPLFLLDYPAFIPTLSKKTGNGMWNERWELYINGLEIANCFTELTEQNAITDFFEKELVLKNSIALEPVQAYSGFSESFTEDYPDCSGVALGVDRLIMLLTEKKSIEGVIFFPFSDIVGQ